MIPPIRKHGSYKEIEEAAFAMKDGEVSPVIAVADQYVILISEGTIPKANVEFDHVAPQLEEIVREKKMRDSGRQGLPAIAGKKPRSRTCLNDPAKAKALPGVAATINGRRITLAELAEQCVERHGEEVLEGTINRRLIELACKKQNITVSEQELDARSPARPAKCCRC